ncbi:hypothetical protein J3R83DRAFT_602 [Lanmaoa asiatica]|nr:hypothetical protein J3R83DRAFT_602 [Lanmaoa asiatica]
MAAEALDFTNVVHVFYGLYIWELIVSSYFEISLIKGKRKVGCVVNLGQKLMDHALIDYKVPFFLCRYGMLWALIGLIISFNVSTEVNCGVAGNTTIASASTSLMIRTIALWEWERWVTITIGILSLGQWGILIRGMNIVQAVWDDSTRSCVVNNTNHLLLNLNYFYSGLVFLPHEIARFNRFFPPRGTAMAFDFVILIFTTVALGRFSRQNGLNGGLSGLLFRDGLIYFLVTSMCNTIPAVLNLLNLNDEMNVIATVPAATTSAVAACRAVIRLKEYGERSNHFSMPTLNIISAVASRYRKASHPQTHRRTNAFSFDELGTTSSPDPNTLKLPTYVEWGQKDGAVNSVDSVIKQTTESQPPPPKHDSFVSIV